MPNAPTPTPDPTTLTAERHDLLETLSKHRAFLRKTVNGLTNDQAAQRTTVSALCLGGIIKHVASAESGWADFIEGGAAAMGGGSGGFDGDWHSGFSMLPDETLAGLLTRYDEVAQRTDHLVATHPDLDASHPLPEAPWFEPGARWSARRVVLHLIAETAQHAGHADIIRESLDGALTMA